MTSSGFQPVNTDSRYKKSPDSEPQYGCHRGGYDLVMK